MNDKFLKEYTAALNKATDLAVLVQKKGVLIEGVDDHLIHDLELANQEVDRLSKQMLSMGQ